LECEITDFLFFALLIGCFGRILHFVLVHCSSVEELMARTMMFSFLSLCLMAQASFAVPGSGTPNPAVVNDQAACLVAQGAIDQDRSKMENLMFALADEDDKPESPAQFRKMCALDKDISAAAGRLGKLINAAPAGCLSNEDKDALSELQRLSKPIEQCAKDGQPGAEEKRVNAKAVEADKPAKKPSQPLNRVTKVPADRTNSIKKVQPKLASTRSASRPASPRPVKPGEIGLMGGLY
jgi:hypothetical protein